jgi:hypothetical protein
MRLYEGEEWNVPVNPRNGDLTGFSEWAEQRQEQSEIQPSAPKDLRLMQQAWDAAPHHFATLRRVGWLDQKGRVWTKIPPSADFDGGSLTPLLIDARD